MPNEWLDPPRPRKAKAKKAKKAKKGSGSTGTVGMSVLTWALIGVPAVVMILIVGYVVIGNAGV